MSISPTGAAICALAATLVPAAALAQDGQGNDAVSAQDQAANRSDVGGLDDIVVTAQRRSQSVQDVPIAVTAFGGDQLANQGMLRVESIALRVPGFYAGSFGASRPQLYIRGVGSRQFDPGSEASVGVFVDEVYLGRSSGVLGALKDIERIEVLRGPQGTLYGRNTIGGAINIITKGPSKDFTAEVQAGISNYSGYELSGAAGGPISADGRLRGRIAGWRTSRDGYVYNESSGGKGSGQDNWGGRVKLDYDLAETITLSGAVEISRDGDGAGFAGVNQGNPGNPRAVFFGKAGLLDSPTGTLRRARWNVDPEFSRSIDAYSFKVAADLGGVDLTSISAYRKQSGRETRDVDGASVDAFNQLTREGSKQFTQEIRLSSSPGGPLTFGDQVNWIIGAYYYNDRSHYLYDPLTSNDSVLNGLLGRNKTDFTYGYYQTESYAGFGQITWRPVKGVELTGGLRYSKDEKKARYVAGTSDPGLPLVVAPFDTGWFGKSFDSLDPRIVATYHFTKDVNVYASFSKGFKSGGFQFSPFTPAAARSIFNPEKVRSYEMGFKSLLLNRKLRLNLSAFDYKYDDLQVSAGVLATTGGGILNVITNAASSTIRGAEAEAVISPTRQIEINLSYAYLDAKYDKYVISAPGQVVSAATDYSGTRLVRAPKHTLSAGAQWTIPINDCDLVLRSDYSYRSTFFHEIGEGNPIYGVQVPLTREKGYGLLDLNATLNSGPWSLSIYVSNVTNKDYRRTVNSLSNVIVGYAGEPRLWGARVGWRY